MKTLNHINILIADDDQDDQTLLLQALTESEINYSSVSFYNGYQLMNYLLNRDIYKDSTHENPDLIFLDINMPVLNGLETLREIKSNDAIKNIPVYVFTTTCSPKEKSDAISLGARRFFTKPCDFDDIKKMVNEVVALN